MAVVVVAVLAGTALADTLTLKDKTTIEGAIVSETADEVAVETSAGLEKVARARIESIALSPVAARKGVTYLSDLEPSSVTETFPDGFERDPKRYAWKRDKEVVSGKPLRLGGRSYEKGLGVHSYSALGFKLAPGFKTFKTTIGLDDSVQFYGTPSVGGRVKFRVVLDGKDAKELPDGRSVKRGDAPSPLSIDVSGVKELVLVVEYGNSMHVLGRADWADAHLVK